MTREEIRQILRRWGFEPSEYQTDRTAFFQFPLLHAGYDPNEPGNVFAVLVADFDVSKSILRLQIYRAEPRGTRVLRNGTRKQGWVFQLFVGDPEHMGVVHDEGDVEELVEPMQYMRMRIAIEQRVKWDSGAVPEGLLTRARSPNRHDRDFFERMILDYFSERGIEP